MANVSNTMEKDCVNIRIVKNVDFTKVFVVSMQLIPVVQSKAVSELSKTMENVDITISNVKLQTVQSGESIMDFVWSMQEEDRMLPSAKEMNA